MPRFPSNLPFISYLQYAPQGTSDASKYSKEIVLKIKTDGFIPAIPSGSIQAINRAIERLQSDVARFGKYSQWFSSDTALIPAPKSTPMLPGAVWPSHRICQELQSRKLGGQVLPIIERFKPVQKAATAPKNKRPNPPEHYDSVRIQKPQQSLFAPKRILFVDDVVTRGSSFVGLVPHLQEAFPSAEILCFSLCRTMSGVEVINLIDPVLGEIHYDGTTGLHREP